MRVEVRGVVRDQCLVRLTQQRLGLLVAALEHQIDAVEILEARTRQAGRAAIPAQGLEPFGEQWVGLLEGDWKFAPGHNLKITGEFFEPDTEVDEDEQTRYSLVWEYVPFQFFQLRAGARIYDGIPQSDVQNRKRYFLSVNGFF